MRNIILKNTKLNSLLSISKYTNAIHNTESTINNIILNPKSSSSIPESILNGDFNSNINILSSISINLKEDFSTTKPFNVYNPHQSSVNLLLYGSIKAPLEDLNINCSNNTSLGVNLSSLNSLPNRKININLNSFDNLAKFNLVSFTSPIPLVGDTINLNLVTPNSGNVNIYTKIYSIDFINSYQINLLLSTGTTINTLNNLSRYTLKSLTIWKDFLDMLTQNLTFKLPVTSILYNLSVSDGLSNVKLDKQYFSSNILSATLNNNPSQDIYRLTL